MHNNRRHGRETTVQELYKENTSQSWQGKDCGKGNNLNKNNSFKEVTHPNKNNLSNKNIPSHQCYFLGEEERSEEKLTQHRALMSYVRRGVESCGPKARLSVDCNTGSGTTCVYICIMSHGIHG